MSSGIPLGLLAALIGLALLYTTRYRRLAKVLLFCGLGVLLFAALVVVLAVNSNM